MGAPTLPLHIDPLYVNVIPTPPSRRLLNLKSSHIWRADQDINSCGKVDSHQAF